MALNVPAGMYVAKLLWRMDGDSETMISTIGVRPADGPPESLVEVAKSVSEAWHGAFENEVLNPAYVFVGADALTPGDGGSEVATYIEADGRGTQANNCLPNNCALLVKKNTGKGGRRNRGRMFLPAGYLPNTEVNHTGAISGWAGTMQSNINQFYENLTDLTILGGTDRVALQPVLFHNGAPGPTPTDVTQLLVDNKIATMRERMR